MAKLEMEILQDLTKFPELFNDKHGFMRSIVFVPEGTARNLLRNKYGNNQSAESEQIITVTDLMDQSSYLVEPIESGYRLFFALSRGEVVVELASDVDLPTIAHDLARRLAELGAQAF